MRDHAPTGMVRRGASFDVVTSCVGGIFAPHHQRAADELVRTPAALRVGVRIEPLVSYRPSTV